MYNIEDFKPYTDQAISSKTAVLTWCKENGYMFMLFENVTNQKVVGYR